VETADLIKALRVGLLLAFLAPLISAVAGAAIVQLIPTSDHSVFAFGRTPTSSLFLIFMFASVMYVQFAVPGFLAGLSLLALRKKLSPVPASLSCGILGTGLHAAFFGPYPISNAVAPYIGIAVAAYAAVRDRADA